MGGVGHFERVFAYGGACCFVSARGSGGSQGFCECCVVARRYAVASVGGRGVRWRGSAVVRVVED